MARTHRTEEEIPPPDALEGVSLPRQAVSLVGHAAAEQTLLAAYRSGRMHHGWILAGPRGIGKATLAFRLARFIFAHPNPGAAEVQSATDLAVPADHPAAHRVAIGVHPNLLHLQRGWDEKNKRHRSELSVEIVRRITPFLGTTAGEGGWRIIIVDPADEMNRSAANAILKNLEEPPRRTLFLLICGSRGALLPTILSRCRTIDLTPLSVTDMERVVDQAAPALADRREGGLAAALAEGSPRRLMELRQTQGTEVYKLMIAAIEEGDRQAQLSLSRSAANGAAVERLMELFQAYLHRRVRGLAEPWDAAKPPLLPLVSWAELWEKTTLSGQEVETFNLDRRQFVLDLLETSATVLRQSGRAASL